MTDGWEEEIGRCFHPYRESTGAGAVVLEQTSDTRFELVSGFSYRCGIDTPIHLAPGCLRGTDLASVPSSLQWMVGSYGRHTFAALLHDALLQGVAETSRQFRDDAWERRSQIDLVFFEALICLGVPRLLSRLMWAAVTIKARWTSTTVRRLSTIVWLGAVLAGSGVMLWGLLNRDWMAVVIAGLMPVAGALLWDKGFRAGLYAGYGVVFVAPPTVLGWAASGMYRVIQSTVGRFFK